ncbi:MAG TPA: ADP-ribosylglycohydrolase family protein [Flavobacteriales bacterium]|nr:ADP-ribosylglycohydrolase family protein [Flavobacteriales bacterium]
MDVYFEDLFLGIAIGDAYGAGLEFQDRYWIKKHVDFSKFINMRTDINTDKKELFTVDYKEWDYTDDAEMSIAVCKALTSSKPFTEELLVNYFVKEYDLGYAKKGYKRNGHGAMRWYFNGEKTIEEIKAFQSGRKYPGNAPPMRAIPLAFAGEEHIDNYARLNANCTHPNPLAVASSILIARCAEGLLLKNISHDQLIQYCLRFIDEPETMELLRKADLLPEPAKLSEGDYHILCGPQPVPHKLFMEGMFGLPSNAMQTAVSALYVIKHSKTTFEGLKHSINMGGDVDSLASICTGILAGKYGINSLPQYMLDNVEGRDYVKEVGQSLKLWFEGRKMYA